MATRRCISCRVTSNKVELLRIVHQQKWFVDFSQISNGRAIYVHPHEACLKLKSFDNGWHKVIEKLKKEDKLPQVKSFMKPDVASLIEEGQKKLVYFESIGVNIRKLKWAKVKLALVLQIQSCLQEGAANNKSLGKKLLRL